MQARGAVALDGNDQRPHVTQPADHEHGDLMPGTQTFAAEKTWPDVNVWKEER